MLSQTCCVILKNRHNITLFGLSVRLGWDKPSQENSETLGRDGPQHVGRRSGRAYSTPVV